MAQVVGVILAGGTGSRMGAELPKQFLPLEGRPVIAWAMEAFNSHRDITGILAVSHRDYIARIRSIAEAGNRHCYRGGGGVRRCDPGPEDTL